ncbi:hypothetical protein [Winogradskyella flava]|uniref:MG2 domain-containing protein n=1 Tax=Winogradskyella flava TaxID=1884876 RepID=A0A842INA9_9FLAO|nr:hypothetical protein [Winogradskyella flava]MBC2843699.1 hypothetical protein [Winogradskyella flava]
MKVSLRLLILSLVFSSISYAQDTEAITEAFEEYAETPREVAYLHLNKSTYIKGEHIGLTAYVLDKKTKRNSMMATNLYVSIEDEGNNIIKQKLLKLENGVASNIIELDSSFTSGHYTIKAYTNWMRNFDQQDYFAETIRIIDPKVEQYIETAFVENTIDAQFLPESGHLLDKVNNTIGVVIKDSKGYGVPNLKGTIHDKDGQMVSEFQVNHLGIGRFLLLPELGNDYTAKIDYKNKAFVFDLNTTIEPVGATLSVAALKDKALVTIATNEKGLEYLEDRPLKLTLHNGNGINAIDIGFEDARSITKSYDLSDLPAGINIFTLFDGNNQPIAERLFFNYDGIDRLQSQSVTAKAVGDSINLKMAFNIDPTKFNSLSVSILPTETDCYSRYDNIMASNFLRPYIKGQIEGSKYYFGEVNTRTKLDMDNLLITQGWSSYDWDDIFSDSVMRYPFERGITIKANVNTKNIKNTEAYMVDISNRDKGLVIKPEKGQKSFIVNNIFLEEDEKLFITEVTKNNTMNVPRLYLQSFPYNVPYLNNNNTLLKPKHEYITLAHLNTNEMKMESLGKVQKLEEVVIVTERDRARLRAEKLNSTRFGNNVEVITSEERQAFFSFEDYVRTKNVQVDDTGVDIIYYLSRNIRPGGVVPMDVFVDDSYFGRSLPRRFILMNNVDYVEINRTGLGVGVGETLKGSGGILRIYTNPKLDPEGPREIGQTYELPLKFAASKTFYVPKYKYYNDEFYLKYGTVDWKPQINSGADGNFDFKIKKPNVPIKLFIEGIANDGSFIFEEKSISLN